MMLAPIVKAVRAYDATEWEIFISEWQKGLKSQKGYDSVKRLGGAGDHGRDVIGLCTAAGCEGDWDNYQCKHYEVPLSTSKACEDAGKIIFHAFRGEFVAPRTCTFVAPRGPSTELRDLLLNPTKFKAELIKTWNVRVAKRVVAGETHLLEAQLETYVKNYDFTSFGFATIDEVLDGHRKSAYWASRFGGLLPPAPSGTAPAIILATESVYVGKLLDVYSEKTGAVIGCVDDLKAHESCRSDLQKQRVRFYDAEAFKAHYRDQTEPGTIEDFAEQIFDAIDPAISQVSTAQGRLTAALTAAGNATPSNVLAPQAKVRVKQGVCHQLANDDRLTWKE
jgi:hypothetical protein